MKKKLPYQEGDWFAVPLRSDGYAVGVVARITKSYAGGIVGYFFGPKRDAIPSLDEMKLLRPEQALWKYNFGDLSLLEGKWPIIGKLPDWERSEWPVPLFVRHDSLSGNAWVVEYDDDDPDQIISEMPVNFEDVRDLPRAGSAGAGAVEIVLTKLLDEGD